MDQKSTYLQKHQVPELIDQLICKLVDEMPANPRTFLADQLAAQADSKYSAKDNQPVYITGEGKNNMFPVLVATALQADVYGRLYQKKTLQGVSLEDILADGLEHNYQQSGSDDAKPSAPIAGVLPGDEHCYEVFAQLLDNVIAAKYGNANIPAKVYQHDTGLGKVNGGFNFAAEVILGGSVRLKRNLTGFRFLPSMHRGERRGLSDLVNQQTKGAFSGNARLAGTCVDYSGSPTQEGLPPICQKLNLIPVPSTISRNAKKEWPADRSIFNGGEGNFFVLVGSQEEHIEVAAVAGENANIRDAFDRAMEGATLLNEAFKKTGNEFCHGERYGYLTANLDNLGSGMVIELLAKIPKLAAHAEFQDVLTKLNLKAEAGDAETTKISNVNLLNKSESEILQVVIAGAEKIIELEAKAAKGEALKGAY